MGRRRRQHVRPHRPRPERAAARGRVALLRGRFRDRRARRGLRAEDRAKHGRASLDRVDLDGRARKAPALAGRGPGPPDALGRRERRAALDHQAARPREPVRRAGHGRGRERRLPVQPRRPGRLDEPPARHEVGGAAARRQVGGRLVPPAGREGHRLARQGGLRSRGLRPHGRPARHQPPQGGGQGRAGKPRNRGRLRRPLRQRRHAEGHGRRLRAGGLLRCQQLRGRRPARPGHRPPEGHAVRGRRQGDRGGLSSSASETWWRRGTTARTSPCRWR